MCVTWFGLRAFEAFEVAHANETQQPTETETRLDMTRRAGRGTASTIARRGWCGGAWFSGAIRRPRCVTATS
jgi:hypothetical protein